MSLYGSIVAGFIEALDPAWAKRQRVMHQKWCDEQLHLAEAWDEETTKFKKVLVIKAETYSPRSLFFVKESKGANINDSKAKQLVVSPDKNWCYAEKVCPRAFDIPLAYGRERGIVLFDDWVRIPALYERDKHSGERWKVTPWMSLTPMETLTLRPGTRRAKGVTIIAGLGLGHQLIEVSKRKQVEKIVLVERDENLVEWLLPRIKPFMENKNLKVVIGDAYKVMPKMRADVALVDIFPGYGCNESRRDKLRIDCPNIGFIWGWGCGAYRDR